MGVKLVHYRSKLYEFLMVPAIVSRDDKHMWKDLRQNQKELLLDVQPHYDKLYQALLPLKSDLLAVSLFEEATVGLAPLLYLYLLEKGEDPADLRALLAGLKALEAEDIMHCLALKLSASKQPKDLLALLEDSDKLPENKWYWYQAIQHPEKLRDQLVSLLEQVFALYQPVYERFEQEVLAFEEDFKAADLLADEALRAKLLEQETQVFVLSPLFIDSFFEKIPSFKSYSFLVSTRSAQLAKAEPELDDERFASILKTLGDETRYKVLLELIQPHAKNKDIAQKLGLTRASISFHTQKLLNSGLLELAVGEDAVKYTVNKELIQKIIEKFKQDLT
ncbi:hypothetical protein STRDD11_00401 [Streptococcus sp. DD11]|nr:winged helix-turn-helix transcriptional regulator [Streptococcus sp. DD11]KXT85342.1 hypothetical protein STRDD11_00401 [Streptococcus sp. DD11]